MEKFDNIRIPWPGWKIVREIGKGTFGTVYEIERQLMSGIEKAAMKVITIPKDNNEYETMLTTAGYDEQAVDKVIRDEFLRVEREYAVMSELRGISNIVSCDDFAYSEKEDGRGYTVFIRMELMESLHSVIKAKRRAKESFTEAEVIRLGKDICRALTICESRNIIHRDIKPGNILLSRFGAYNLADFGTARTLDHTTQATLAGTMSFMAPEMFKLEKYGATVDIYSLGLVMYWLLNHYRMPFVPLDRIPTADDIAQAGNRRLSGENLPAPCDASRELSEIILKACAYNSNDRYRSASEMLTELEQVGSETGSREKQNILQEEELLQTELEKTQLEKNHFDNDQHKLPKQRILPQSVQGQRIQSQSVQEQNIRQQQVRKQNVQRQNNQQQIQKQKKRYKKNKNAENRTRKSFLGKNIRIVAVCACILLLAGGLWFFANNGWEWPAGDSQNAEKGIKSVKSVAMRYGNTAIIDQNDRLWMWGNNSEGQIGDGTTNDRTTPVKIMDDVQEAAIGYKFSAALKTDGSLWTWGYNGVGQLGDGIEKSRLEPKMIMDDVQTVSVGFNSVAAIKTDGSLWIWGYYDYFHMGEDTMIIPEEPIKIMEDVKSVALIDNTRAVIKTDGSLWIWGENDKGQIGDGTNENRLEPVRIMQDVQEVSLGEGHSAAIKTDGSLWMWGENNTGQLGDGTRENRLEPVRIMDNAKTVSLGYSHSAVIKTDGSLWLWGDNLNNQVGVEPRDIDFTEIDADDFISTMRSTTIELVPVKLMDDVMAIALAYNSSAAIKNDGSLWMWGLNDECQLGEITEESRKTPVFQALPINEEN